MRAHGGAEGLKRGSRMSLVHLQGGRMNDFQILAGFSLALSGLFMFTAFYLLSGGEKSAKRAVARMDKSKDG
jgi:hypothetical protein